VRIAVEPFDGADSADLMRELAAELRARYAGDAEPGTKPSPADVAVFLLARDDAGRPLGCGALRRLETGVEQPELPPSTSAPATAASHASDRTPASRSPPATSEK
jgi:hypothetical protein